MLPSQASHRLELASTGAVCLAERSAGRPAHRGERGAVVVHVAVAMMGLLAFAALSIDLGTLWVVRAQVQNAADAAALSGGVSLAYVTPDPSVAADSALAIAQQHKVWGQTLNAAAVASTVGSCPAGAPSVSGDCINVTVSQGGASGTPLPVFFSRLFTSMTPEVHATASAKVLLGNASPCMRPIAIPDSWFDTHDTTPDAGWTDDDTYDRYIDSGFPVPPADADTYIAPSAGGPGSGITLASMNGVRIQREVHRVWLTEPLRAMNFLPLEVARPGGAADYEQRYFDNFMTCSGTPVSIGDSLEVIYPHPHFTADAIHALIDQDPGAYWDGASIQGSAFVVSPRLITVAVIDPDAYARQIRPGANIRATVTNLVGLFLESTFAADLQGVIVPTSGSFNTSAPAITDQSTFLRTVALVR